jgi:hypothetical protein
MQQDLVNMETGCHLDLHEKVYGVLRRHECLMNANSCLIES